MHSGHAALPTSYSMKFYLKVPYPERRTAKAAGALWEPSTKRWYCVSETVWNRCRAWQLPLTTEQQEYLASPARAAAYSRAMDAYNAEPKFKARPQARYSRSTSRGGQR